MEVFKEHLVSRSGHCGAVRRVCNFWEIGAFRSVCWKVARDFHFEEGGLGLATDYLLTCVHVSLFQDIFAPASA